jgi:esterase/lipase superfamily enzyme
MLGACADRPEFGALLVADAVSPTAAVETGARPHTILVATTRARDDRPGTLFNGERATALDFASATISVPPSHVKGRIEWPRQERGDASTDFVAKSAGYLDGEAGFVAELDRELVKRPPGKRHVMIFVHGYNTMFAEGLYRLAQIVDDAGSTSVPVHFSWASRGQLAGYVYDNNSATMARDGLERTLRLIAASKAERIDILAHSMGNWVTVEAIRQIKISGAVPPASKVGFIVLASPDIDIDVFETQMRRLGKPKKPFFIVISKDDRALGLSRWIAGDKDRLGASQNEAELTRLGATVIDLTDVKSDDDLNHGKFAEIADIAPQLREVLEAGVGSKKSEADGEPGSNAARIVTLPLQAISAPIRILTRQ